MTIKGAIFDMDGVVIDNYPFHFKAWMEFAQKHKFLLNAEIYRDKFNGKTNADLFTMLFGSPTPEEMQKYADEKEGMYRELYLPHMTAHRGLVEFLISLRQNKIKIALGTSAPTSNVDFVLDRLNLRQYFDVIVDGTMVTKGKPDPEVYLSCANRLGLNPATCVVFEDSLAGLESGRRAGCKTVGVATSHQAWELKSHTDDIIVDFRDKTRFF